MFLWSAVVLVTLYVGIRFGVPRLSVLIGASEGPAPVPKFAVGIYMICAVVGTFVYVSSDEGRLREFLTPVIRLFAFQAGAAKRGQLLVLGLLPLIVGWIAWQVVMPHTQTSAVVRVQHPGLPSQFVSLENPFAELGPAERDAVEREGVVLFQQNCRPCHGTKADGNGPLARGLRLRPVDFTDPGTIATVVEPYPYWRITEGGVGLPGVATPWNSAMPAWGDELQPEDIWRIIMAEYRIAGTEPRRPEGAEN